MPGSGVKARIHDMLNAIDTIESIDKVKVEAPPELARLARERAFEILSEASRHIPEDLKATERDVAWNKIAGLGDVLRHDYQAVNQEILDNASSRHLPGLRDALLRFRDRLNKE